MQIPPGQHRILSFFADAEDHGRQASRAEAAVALKYAFPSAVSKHVEALVRKGLMTANREKKRNARLTEAGWATLGRTPCTNGVPVIGSIAAGQPILASEHLVDHLEDITALPGRFALQIRGESMIEAGINDGDYAIIDADQTVREGDIGAVIIDDEATLKRLRYRRSELILEPANSAYKPIVLNKRKPPGNFRIIGPLRFVYRPFR